MNQSFPNAPLIELAAQVRWTEPALKRPDEGDDFVVLAQTWDPVFDRLGQVLARHGYSRTERLLPQGSEIEEGQPVIRYRRAEDTETTVIFQAGAGAFSVNAIPPYKTWSDFRPAIEIGLMSLVEALAESDLDRLTTSISLNYINAFDERFTGGDRMKFLESTLGFNVQIPPGVQNALAGEPDNAFLSLSGRTADGDRMQFKTGLGNVQNTPQVILDCLALSRASASLNMSEVMLVFDRLHSVIHDTFMTLAKSFIGVLEGE